MIIGEFGLPSEPALGDVSPELASTRRPRHSPDEIAQLVQATDLHNSTWVGAMSASGAMSWWWGGYIRDNAAQHRTPPEFPANERHNPPLHDFFAGEDSRA